MISKVLKTLVLLPIAVSVVVIILGMVVSAIRGGDGPATVAATDNSARDEHLASAREYQAAGEYGLALIEADQAVAASRNDREARSLRDAVQREATAQARASATAEAKEIAAARAAQAAEAKPAVMWTEYRTGYGPKLADIVSRSDTIDATAVVGTVVATARDRGSLYNIIEKAAQGQGGLRREVNQVRVPDEAKALKDALHSLVMAREDAMKKQKEALDKPGAASEGALISAKNDANTQVARVVLEIARLCEKMQSPAEECFGSVGFTRS